MSRASLYREGARLPEQLSRLLFLEPVLQGRRVLEVGAHSDAVARFLLELGATRVVCASADKDLIDAMRERNTLEHVDFRVIRPGVLPGDDGAFDLVVDFSLASALAAGETFRLTDIARLLSRDGFAVTAIESQSVRGLGALLGDPTHAPVFASERSAAGLSGAPGPVGYRQLVDALKLQFDLVQVYFQSLLVGYLFGTFDVEPSGDGVSPATALMGDEPEPAGHYLFAFGNAVPVIEDVALVQVPFAEMLQTIGKGPPDAEATLTPTPIAPHAAPVAAEDASEQVPEERRPDSAAVDDDEIRALRREHAAQAHALTHIAIRTEELRVELGQLLAVLDARTTERDELGAFVEGLQAAIAARDVQLDEARLALEQLSALAEARTTDSERSAALEGVIGEAENALVRSEAERAALEQALMRAEQERATLAEALEDLSRTRDAERKRAQVERDALEDAARALSVQAAQVPQLEAALSAQAARFPELEAVLAEAREAAIQARHDADVRADEIKKLRVVEDRAHMLEGELDETRRLALHAQAEAADRERLKAREQDLADALLKADARVRELESEALKLAEGVKVLVGEREEARARLDKETARLSGLLQAERDNTRAQLSELSQQKAASDASARTSSEELRSAQERLEALLKEGEGKDKRLKAAHAALEEARRDLVGAREGLQEIAGQRDTLQQVLRARERELEAARQQLLDAAGDSRRLEEQLESQHKALAEARDRLAAAELERVQAARRADEHGARVLERDQDLTAQRAQLEAVRAEVERERANVEDAGRRLLAAQEDAAAGRAQLDSTRAEAERTHATLEVANRRLLAAEEEGMSLLARLEDEERARAQDGRIHAQAIARAEQLERDLTLKILAEQGAVAAAEEARRALADELVSARTALDDERARTRADALAQQEALTNALADAETSDLQLKSELAAHEQRRAMRDAEIESLRAVLEEAQITFDRERARSEMLDGTLLEIQGALLAERSRAELLRATLEEAQGMLARERANSELQRDALQEARSLLSVERARGDLFAEEIGEAQQHILTLRERMRATIMRVQTRAESATGSAATRADLQHELLAEAQEQLGIAAARAHLLEGELEDARATFSTRRAHLEAAVEGERVRSAAALSDAQSARERVKALEDSVTRMAAVGTERDVERQTQADADAERVRSLEHALAEERASAMLLQAAVEKNEALAESAVRERDAVLGDLTAHQARANAESQRRQSIEEELAKLRVAHNQALADVQKHKLDADADRRAAVPELEAQLEALKSRVESLEKAAEGREAKIAEQTDLISRLKDRLVRIQDQS